MTLGLDKERSLPRVTGARIHPATIFLSGILATVIPRPIAAQVDQGLARQYFAEAESLCTREAGRLWGVSLCGPMVFADAATGTVATNQPPPSDARPRALGYANAAMDWGGTRWSTFVWRAVPQDDPVARARLMVHELFHRVQPQIGLFLPLSGGENDHLETLEGRYWMQLEWRALAVALASTGPERLRAMRDALAFRRTRRAAFGDAAELERRSEINEGLAQYTATVVAAASVELAAASAITQLGEAPSKQSFVRTFAYASGAAYGILLDAWSPAWTRRIGAGDDLGQLLMDAAGFQPGDDARAASGRYGGAELRLLEERREGERRARVAELRRRFVEGPVLVVPRGRNAAFITTGVTPIPGAGTIYPSFRVAGDWGSLEAAEVLMSEDGNSYALPGPVAVRDTILTGDGWTITLASGWGVRPGMREGDLRVVRETR